MRGTPGLLTATADFGAVRRLRCGVPGYSVGVVAGAATGIRDDVDTRVGPS